MGSDAGAFAAGLLAGWTASGTRPQFRVVTGISAGALIAPFAFLGPQYDDVIRGVFTSVRSEDVFHRRSMVIGLASDGMVQRTIVATRGEIAEPVPSSVHPHLRSTASRLTRCMT